MALAAERASSGSWGDAEGMRVAHVVHAPGEVVVLVVRADRLEAPVM
jgi:hypothetical protein